MRDCTATAGYGPGNTGVCLFSPPQRGNRTDVFHVLSSAHLWGILWVLLATDQLGDVEAAPSPFRVLCGYRSCVMEFIFLHVVIWSVVIFGALLLYLRSGLSRKDYACPHCGERLSVELMDATNCTSCGMDLRRDQS